MDFFRIAYLTRCQTDFSDFSFLKRKLVLSNSGIMYVRSAELMPRVRSGIPSHIRNTDLPVEVETYIL